MLPTCQVEVDRDALSFPGALDHLPECLRPLQEQILQVPPGDALDGGDGLPTTRMTSGPARNRREVWSSTATAGSPSTTAPSSRSSAPMTCATDPGCTPRPPAGTLRTPATTGESRLRLASISLPADVHPASVRNRSGVHPACTQHASRMRPASIYHRPAMHLVPTHLVSIDLLKPRRSMSDNGVVRTEWQGSTGRDAWASRILRATSAASSMP